MGCTPLAAARELALNPELEDVVRTVAFEDAYNARIAWERLSSSDRAQTPQPAGQMDIMVQRFRLERVRAANAGRD